MSREGVNGGARAARLTIALALVAMAAGCGPVGEEVQVLRPDGDILAAGPELALGDTTSGDVMSAGGAVEFAGATEGSYLGVGGSQEVRGRIGGSARVAAGSVRLGAEVGRNVTLAGGTVALEESALVHRNAYLVGGAVSVAGRVVGDLRAGGEEVVLDGRVEGDVDVEADRLVVGPSATIGGDLRYTVEEGEASIARGAIVEGRVEARPARPEGPGRLFFSVARVLGFLLAGVLSVALLPGGSRMLADGMGDRPAASLGVGLLWLILVPLAVVVAAITVIGVPVALVALSLYAVSLYLAPVVPAVWLGDALLASGGRAGGPEAGEGALRAFLVGGLILGLAALLPWVGVLVRLAATLLGLGAAALVLVGRRAGA